MYDEKNRGTWIFVPCVKPNECDFGAGAARIHDATGNDGYWVGDLGHSHNFPTSGPPLQPPTPTLTTCDDCGFRWESTAAASCYLCDASAQAIRVCELEKSVAVLQKQNARLRDDLHNVYVEQSLAPESATSTAKPAQRGPRIVCDSGWDD